MPSSRQPSQQRAQRSSGTLTTSLQDHFLISMPQLEDPNFSGALTYICEHSTQGAMGIIVNKPSGLTLEEILEQLDIPSHSNQDIVYAGGPVQMDRGFILHSSEKTWESSMQITPNCCLTTSLDILEAIASDEGPSDYLIALGYAGWGAGQLEQELAENTWLTCQADQKILFDTPNSKKLNAAMASLGVNASQLSSKMGHA